LLGVILYPTMVNKIPNKDTYKEIDDGKEVPTQSEPSTTSDKNRGEPSLESAQSELDANEKSKTVRAVVVVVVAVLGLGIIFWMRGNLETSVDKGIQNEQDKATGFDGRIKLHTGQLPSLAEFSERRAYINPKIIDAQSGVVMPGLPDEYYEPDNIEKSYQDGVWYEADRDLPEHHRRYNDFLSVREQFGKVDTLRIGEATPTGTRVVVNTIVSSDENVFLVQVGIEEFRDTDAGYPFGFPFTLAEDYECNLAELTCTETDILKKADAYMATNDVTSETSLVFTFWHFWNREGNNLIGYRSGEGASPDVIYMYYPLRGEHIETGGEGTRGLDFSPSMQRMMIIDAGGMITTYDIRNDFTQLQKASSSNLKEFFEYPYSDYSAPLSSYRKIWSQDEGVVYFVDPRQGQSSEVRIFSHQIDTGVTDRLIDATPLYELPRAHAQSIEDVQLQPIGPELSRSGRYLHYYLWPVGRSHEETEVTHVIIDMFDENKAKQITSQKPESN